MDAKKKFKIQLETSGKEFIFDFKGIRELRIWIENEEKYFDKKYIIKEELGC